MNTEKRLDSTSKLEMVLLPTFQKLLNDKKLLPHEDIKNLNHEVITWAFDHAEFKAQGYNRKTICGEEGLSEVVLACWLKGQVTPIHNHPNISCWIYIVKGQIQETLIPKEIIENQRLEALSGSPCWSTYCAKKAINAEKSSNISQRFGTKIMQAGDWSYIDDTKGVHSMHALTDEVISLHFYRSL